MSSSSGAAVKGRGAALGVLAGLLALACVLLDPVVETRAVQGLLQGGRERLRRQGVDEMVLDADEVSARFGHVVVRGARVAWGGATLEVPRIDATYSVMSLLGAGNIEIHELGVHGIEARLDGARLPVQKALEVVLGAGAGALLGGTDNSLNNPLQGKGLLALVRPGVDISVDRTDLDGRLILAPSGGRPPVSVRFGARGGGLGPEKEGAFVCTWAVDSTGKSGPVTVLGRATFRAGLSPGRSWVRLALDGQAVASGAGLPGRLSLTYSARVERTQAGEAYTLSLSRDQSRLAFIQAEFSPLDAHIVGTWSVDLGDGDIEPFSMGRPVPSFAAHGHGSFAVDGNDSSVRTEGALVLKVDGLGLVRSELRGIGGVTVRTRFDLSRHLSSLRVDGLEVVAEAGSAPAFEIRALQAFAFDSRSGELKVADPTADLAALSLTAVPLSWLGGWGRSVEVRGAALHGECAVRAGPGGFSFRTRSPLEIAGLSVSTTGRDLLSGLDLSAYLLANYSPQGWQIQVAPLTLSTARGDRLLRLEARLGHLIGAQDPVRAEGSWVLFLPGIGAQPVDPLLRGLSAGELKGDFLVNFGPAWDVEARGALTDGRLADGRALPQVIAELRLARQDDGHVDVQLPVHITRGEEVTDASFAGQWYREGAPGGRLVGKVHGVRIRGEDLLPVVGLWTENAALDGVTAPQASLSVSFDRVSAAERDFRDVSGEVFLGPGTVTVAKGRASFGDQESARLDASVSHRPPEEGGAFTAQGSFAVDEIDALAVLQGLRTLQVRPVEGRFSLGGTFSAQGHSLREMLDGARGVCRVNSKGGAFRALQVRLPEMSPPSRSILAATWDSLTGLFGHKGDRKQPTFDDFMAHLGEIRFDQMSATLTRGPDLDVVITDFSMIAPEERITGTGRVNHVPGSALGDQPLSLELTLSARGQTAGVLKAIGLLGNFQDDLGYTAINGPVHLGGTLGSVDASDWRDLVVRSAVHKATGSLLERLIGP